MMDDAMYEPHESFDFPKNLRSKIWRYIEFSKYIAMLESQSLYFCRADQLGEAFEGSVPGGTVKNLDKRITKVRALGTEEARLRAKEMEGNLDFFQWAASVAQNSMYV